MQPQANVHTFVCIYCAPVTMGVSPLHLFSCACFCVCCSCARVARLAVVCLCELCVTSHCRVWWACLIVSTLVVFVVAILLLLINKLHGHSSERERWKEGRKEGWREGERNGGRRSERGERDCQPM